MTERLDARGCVIDERRSWWENYDEGDNKPGTCWAMTGAGRHCRRLVEWERLYCWQHRGHECG